MDADLNYYERRSAEEAAAAALAEDARVREAHLELARRYEQRISSIEAQRRRADFRLVSAG